MTAPAASADRAGDRARITGMVERGELLGQGASCRVYSWGEDQVVKVFRRAFDYLAPIEVERVTAVHEAGAPTPAVHGIVSLEGRVGIVFDRIRGPSLLDELVARRLTRADVGQRTAEVHIAVQELTATKLPQLADALRERGIDGMPVGETVFHGDFHPGNILLQAGRPFVIDWSGAHAAPAGGRHRDRRTRDRVPGPDQGPPGPRTCAPGTPEVA